MDTNAKQSWLTRRSMLKSAAVAGLWISAGCRPIESFEPTAVPAPRGQDQNPATEPESRPGEAPLLDPDISLESLIGQLFVIGFRGLEVQERDPIVQDIVQRNLGGVVLFSYDVPNRELVRNIESPEQLEELNGTLQSVADNHLLIAVDQEGGNVARLNEQFGFPSTLSHAALGEIDDPERTYEHSRQMARTLRSVGINHNLAPVVDVNVNPDSPAIGAFGRSFSADVDKVTEHAAAFVEAHHDEGVTTTLKHFPGHGSAQADSHDGFVDLTETWSELELEPYKRLISLGLSDSIMTAHVYNREWDAADPATLSRAVITGMLRDEMGYSGVVISDDLQMQAIRGQYTFEDAIRKSLDAGVDVIAIANNSVYEEDILSRGIDVIMALVHEGTISSQRLHTSYKRVQDLKSRTS